MSEGTVIWSGESESFSGKVMSATGGTVTDIGVDNKVYRVHAFTSVGNSTFEVTDNPTEIEYVIVAGGGAGGGSYRGGGGGAGGLIHGFTVLGAGTYNVKVGAGGTGSSGNSGNSGGNSEFDGVVAYGGGGGGYYEEAAPMSNTPYGSGGGGAGGNDSYPQTGSIGTPGQGTSGGGGSYGSGPDDKGGGGGGAAEPGFNGEDIGTGQDVPDTFDVRASNGGNGRFFDWVLAADFGEAGYLAGGGAAGGYDGGWTADSGAIVLEGGLGGGADGTFGNNPYNDGKNGEPNTGGGGSGASGGSGGIGGDGGAGIVMLRYRIT